MNLNTETIRAYLSAIGAKVHDTEVLTHFELGQFAAELQHKTGVLYQDVAKAMDDAQHLADFVLEHIESVIGGKLPEQEPVAPQAPVAETQTQAPEAPEAPPAPIAPVVQEEPKVEVPAAPAVEQGAEEAPTEESSADDEQDAAEGEEKPTDEAA